MKLLCGIGVVLGCIVGMLPGVGGGANANGLRITLAQAPPDEPVDPNATAGVRGGGPLVKVEVQYKRKPVADASVVAKNPDGRVAGWCNTNPAGECLLGIGPGSYTLTATQNGLRGTAPAQVTAQVTGATKPIAIKLEKDKTGTK